MADMTRRGRRVAWALAAVAALAPVATAPAAHAGTAATPAPVQAGAPAGVRYLDEVFDEVERTEGVEYREAVTVDGTTQQLHLDVYEPAGDTAERRPVVLLMHG